MIPYENVLYLVYMFLLPGVEDITGCKGKVGHKMSLVVG